MLIKGAVISDFLWENRKIDSLNDKLYIIWQLRIEAAPSFGKIFVIRRIFFIVLKEFKPEPAWFIGNPLFRLPVGNHRFNAANDKKALTYFK